MKNKLHGKTNIKQTISAYFLYYLCKRDNFLFFLRFNRIIILYLTNIHFKS